MKKLIFLILFLRSLSVFSQNDSLEKKFFCNDSIKYDIIFKSRTVTGDTPMAYYIKVRMTNEFAEYLLSQNADFWIEKLVNDKTDWATNLVLYFLFRKNATSFLVVYTDRRKWLHGKEEDVKYWKDFLTKPRRQL